MVFDRPQQIIAARASADCFFAQSYPFKELVIFNATPYALSRWWPPRRKCLEIRLKPRSPTQMVAICLENSNGEWCANWLPDCWYGPEYLNVHMQHRDKQRIVLFRHKQVYSLKDKKLVLVSNDSVLCWSFYRHFPIDLESKQPLVEQFGNRMEIDNPAQLIVKFAREIL